MATQVDTGQGSQGDCRQPHQPGICPALDDEPPQAGQYQRFLPQHLQITTARAFVICVVPSESSSPVRRIYPVSDA